MKRIKNFGTLSIIFYLISIVMYIFALFIFKNALFGSLGALFFSIGLFCFLRDRDEEKHKAHRGFEPVINSKRKTDCYCIPTRSSENSAGYDFYADKNYTIEPNQIVKIWTDIKAFMQPDEFLMLDVRSSMGGKFMLANTIGIIDSDYYSNPDNDGNICFMLKNISNEVQHIERNNKIGQGIFMEYLKIDNDNTTTKRNGGLGSSGK